MSQKTEVEYMLYRCPFCGSDALELLQTDEGNFVTCYRCSALGPTKNSGKAAIEAWNSRPFQFDTRKKEAKDF